MSNLSAPKLRPLREVVLAVKENARKAGASEVELGAAKHRRAYTAVLNGDIPTVLVNGRHHVTEDNELRVAQALGLNFVG